VGRHTNIIHRQGAPDHSLTQHDFLLFSLCSALFPEQDSLEVAILMSYYPNPSPGQVGRMLPLLRKYVASIFPNLTLEKSKTRTSRYHHDSQ